jgi:hypothetical protein
MSKIMAQTLTDAILKGTHADVERMIAQGADIHQLDMYGFTPLIEAAIANRLDIADLLIKNGADVKQKDMTGGTALQWAVENYNMQMCYMFLKRGADPNAYTRFSQPLLVFPLLRRQHDLKEMLYRAGADLKFAQDYINAKLLGHRFELTGRVDIVDNKNTFIEMDFAGFILEFTVGIMQDSLVYFRNNFSSRNLRQHFYSLQIVIDAFEMAAEMLTYQQHLIDINNYQDRINFFASQENLLLPVGYEGHAITFIKCGQLFAKCDRGENSLTHPSVQIYKLGNPRAYHSIFIKNLVYKIQNTAYVTEGIEQALGLEPMVELPMPSQLTGNCSWANVEAVIPTFLLMQWINQNPKEALKHIEAYQNAALEIYKQWLNWDKDWALHQCIESFYNASPARKASKAAILAAVLFQTCRFHTQEDTERSNKILSIFSAPEYQYVLNAYLKVYGETKVGKNLIELLDLYSH